MGQYDDGPDKEKVMATAGKVYVMLTLIPTIEGENVELRLENVEIKNSEAMRAEIAQTIADSLADGPIAQQIETTVGTIFN